MADEQPDVFTVIEHATVEISAQTPMELLLADSSRANSPACGVRAATGCTAATGTGDAAGAASLVS